MWSPCLVVLTGPESGKHVEVNEETRRLELRAGSDSVFYFEDGRTTVSCSGILFRDSMSSSDSTSSRDSTSSKNHTEKYKSTAETFVLTSLHLFRDYIRGSGVSSILSSVNSAQGGSSKSSSSGTENEKLTFWSGSTVFPTLVPDLEVFIQEGNGYGTSQSCRGRSSSVHPNSNPFESYVIAGMAEIRELKQRILASSQLMDVDCGFCVLRPKKSESASSSSSFEKQIRYPTLNTQNLPFSLIPVGSRCVIRGSPFGFVKRSLFSDVVTHATVANRANDVLLLDTLVHDGMEGSIVSVLVEKSQNSAAFSTETPVGLLLPPLKHKTKGETVSFSLAISIDTILNNMKEVDISTRRLQLLSQNGNGTSTSMSMSESKLPNYYRSILGGIRSRNVSGVVVTSGNTSRSSLSTWCGRNTIMGTRMADTTNDNLAEALHNYAFLLDNPVMSNADSRRCRMEKTIPTEISAKQPLHANETDLFHRNSIVYILNPTTSRWASGIVLTESGLILSCAHIVRSKKENTPNDETPLVTTSKEKTEDLRPPSPNDASVSKAPAITYTQTTSYLRAQCVIYEKGKRDRKWLPMVPVWISDTYLDCALFVVSGIAIQKPIQKPNKEIRVLKPIPWVFIDNLNSAVGVDNFDGTESSAGFAGSSILSEFPTRIYGCGYGIFEQNSPGALFEGPVITEGVLGKRVYRKLVEDKSIMNDGVGRNHGAATSSRNQELSLIRSSASIHHGNSGGAMVVKNGLFGLVIMNVRGTKTIPSVNFSIPTDRLKPIYEIARRHRKWIERKSFLMGNSVVTSDYATANRDANRNLEMLSTPTSVATMQRTAEFPTNTAKSDRILSPGLFPAEFTALLDGWNKRTISEEERLLWSLAMEDAVERREEISLITQRKMKASRCLDFIDREVGVRARL